jgi:hypothetical protein
MATTEVRQHTGIDKAALRPFRANFPDSELGELRRRISATRWPDRETVAGVSDWPKASRNMILWRNGSFERRSSPFRRSPWKATPMARRIRTQALTPANSPAATSIGSLSAELGTICRKRRQGRLLRRLSTSPRPESDRQDVGCIRTPYVRCPVHRGR